MDVLLNKRIKLPDGAVIKSCPCCGAEAEIRAVDVYNATGIQISCPKCYMQHYPVIEGTYSQYKENTNVTFSHGEAVCEALKPSCIRSSVVTPVASHRSRC